MTKMGGGELSEQGEGWWLSRVLFEQFISEVEYLVSKWSYPEGIWVSVWPRHIGSV